MYVWNENKLQNNAFNYTRVPWHLYEYIGKWMFYGLYELKAIGLD